MEESAFRRVIYESIARFSPDGNDLIDILAQSRLNNGLDGVSGLLWTDGERYVQLLEGPPESVALTLERILRDSRHTRVKFVSDGNVEGRAFGDWSMADVTTDETGSTGDRLSVMMSGAPAEVRDVFNNLN